MGLAADLLDLCTDKASWLSLQTRDSYGKPTYTLVHADYPARLVRQHKIIRKGDGQETSSSAQLWVLPSLTSGDPFPAIKPHDQVKLSDNTTPQILDTRIYQDEFGPSHCVVFFV